MFTARRINHPAIVCALACALLAFATSSTAAARPNQHTKASAALAQERYYASYGTPPPTAAARERAALAQERYYSSYGEPTPLIAPQPPAPSDDG